MECVTLNLDTEKILMLDFYGGNWQVFLAQAPLAKVIREKSRGEGSLMEQDTIENGS